MFKIMAKEDQVDRGQVIYHMYIICQRLLGDADGNLHDHIIASLATNRLPRENSKSPAPLPNDDDERSLSQHHRFNQKPSTEKITFMIGV